LSGQEIIAEDSRIREMLKQSNEYCPALMWDYIEEVAKSEDAKCTDGIDRNCHKRALDNSIKNCELDVVLTKLIKNKIYNADYMLGNLRNEKDYMKINGPDFWPAVVINGMTFRGNLNVDHVFEAICQGFETRPSECKQADLIDVDVGSGTFIFIVITLVVMLVGLIWMLKRRMKQTLH
jgi:hypothetical protein